MERFELVSLRELSRRTSVSLREVQNWRDREGLPVYKLGKRRQTVVWDEFKEWPRAHGVKRSHNEPS